VQSLSSGEKERRRTTKENLGEGLALGAIMAVFYSVIAVVIYLVRGRGVFEKMNLTLPGIIALYFFAGLTAGAIGGVLRPFGRRAVGAMLVGIVSAVIPCFLGAMIVRQKEWDSRTVILGALLSAVVLGCIYGWAAWSTARDDQHGH
jgi:cation transporter-like permease